MRGGDGRARRRGTRAAGGRMVENSRHDHPLPSACAFSLRIDEPRKGGHGAPRAPRPPPPWEPQPWEPPPWEPQPWEPPRRGSTVREDREFLSSLRRASLRRAVSDPTVKESLSSLFILPRARAAGAAGLVRGPAGRAAGCVPPPGAHSWLTGARAKGMLMTAESVDGASNDAVGSTSNGIANGRRSHGACAGGGDHGLPRLTEDQAAASGASAADGASGASAADGASGASAADGASGASAADAGRPGGVVRIGKIRKGPFLILPIRDMPPRPPAARQASTSRPGDRSRRIHPGPVLAGVAKGLP